MDDQTDSWVVGADLGASKIALGLVGPGPRIAARLRMPTDGHAGATAVVERIARGVAELEGSLPAGQQLVALGICSPGPVDSEAGTVIEPPNLAGLHHTPLRRLLADRLSVPVALEHDARAAALGEYHYGAGRGERSMVYIVVGTGVGAAIIIDGELYRGPHNAAGEVGHTTHEPGGQMCSCGNRGCVETHLAGPWLARRYERLVGDADVGEQGAAKAPVTASVTGELVARLAARGDARAIQVMREAGVALGTAVATMAMVLDIDLFVVGSSVAKAGDLLLGPARESVPAHAYASVASRVRIVPTALGDDGPILGCAWLAWQASGASGR